jgi:hypothetical protein
MYTMHAIIDRIEQEVAVIRTNDGQTLLWHVDNMPTHLREGDEIVLEIKGADEAKRSQEALAREVLDEIFNHKLHVKEQADLF